MTIKCPFSFDKNSEITLGQSGNFKNLAETFHTCFLYEYMGVLFSFFRNFFVQKFLYQNEALGFCTKMRLWDGEPKNCGIWLKFSTRFPCMNTWGCFFLF